MTSIFSCWSSDTDWPIEENQSTSSSSGGGVHGRGRHQPLSHQNAPALLHSPSGGQRLESADGHRPSSQAMKRTQVRRHHTVTSEHPVHGPPPQRASMDLESHYGQRNPQFYQPPPSVYDDDPGIMSEVETSATGFRRGNKIRSTLPVVHTPSKTQERPLEMPNEPQYAGLVFLQYRSETKRALLPNEITTLDTIKALFVRSFPKQLSMEYLDSPHIRIYIHDPSKDMFYELEDLRDVRDRAVLRIYERDVNGGEVYSTWDQDVSYFSEPEFDSEYQNQHIHRTKTKSSAQAPSYYGRVSPYTSMNMSQTLPHGASIRCYSPTPSERHKPQTLRPVGPVQPPPKPQRTFQQGVPVLPVTPPPPGPPPSIPSPRTVPSYPMERRHEPQGAYLAPPERIYPSRGQSPYYPSPEHRYEPSYHSSPDRSGHDLEYLSSPEHRYDHQQSFPIYGNSSFEEPTYYGERIYGTRSGSVTPVVDEQTRLRVEHMERQLANLTGLVQKALSTGPPPRSHSSQQIPTRDTESQHAKERIEKGYSSEREEAEPEMARQLFKEEKSVSFSDETTTVNSSIPKQHSPQHAAERPAKPAIKTSAFMRSQSSESEVVPTTSSTTVMPAEREGRPSGTGKPAPPPKPASLSGALLEVKQHTSFSSKEFHLNPELYTQLRQLRKQTKDLKLEVRNLRRVAQAQAVTAKETVRDTCIKIKAMIASVQVGEDQSNAERQRISQEEELYRQDVTRLEKDLTELENQVEELRGNVINRRCRVNISDVESMALVLSRASKNVADLKARFPNLQQTMKTIMTAEMEVVIREEKFLKEEPDRLESALRRCKKLTGTLVTLKRLASVQEQRHSGAHPLPEKSASADGPHSDGETHATKIVDSDSHTVIHVPPDGHQKIQRSETTLDTLLDDLQILTKVSDAKRDFIPGKSGPQRRLPSYPSADSPVRTPIHVYKTLSTGSQEQTTSNKLQVGMGKRSLSLSPTPSFSDGRTSPYSHEQARAIISSLRKSTEGQESIQQSGTTHSAQKKVPPPPPPRTTSCSPVTSPTNPTSTRQKDDMSSKTYSHMRSNSEPAGSSESNVKKIISSRSVGSTKQDSFDKGNEIVRTSAIIDDESFPRDHLSSNSSSSESVNSQEGLQMILHGKVIMKDKKLSSRQSSTDSNASLEYEENTKKQGPHTPNKMRQELLEQRHQELLKKQKQLQEQYARLQQMQRGQLRFSPPRSSSTTTVGDLKKTGSESNILSKAALSLTPSSGSMTHLAVTSSVANHTGHTSPSQGISRSPISKIAQNKIFETDIL